MRHLGLAFLLSLTTAGCVRQDDSSAASSARTTGADTVSAHEMVLSATACWLGGVWNDAIGEATPPVRHCERVLRTAYGKVELVRVERLRAFEPDEVRELGARIRRRAMTESELVGRPDVLGRFYDGIAAAMREETIARRAADRVVMDTNGPRDRDLRPIDARTAGQELGASDALIALRTTDFGLLTPEARAIALIVATDRMRLAVDLPKHLKIIAVGNVFHDVFGVTAPILPADAAAPPAAGTWLGYLSDVARAAGRPVPTSLSDVRDREAIAWADVLEGFADRLRSTRDTFVQANELETVTDGVTKRLDTEFREAEASLLARGLPAHE